MEDQRASAAAAPEKRPLSPGDVFDRYTIEAKIGAGGMGVVYRAHDARLHRRVAIKLVRTERFEGGAGAVPDLLREARAAAALDHPGAVAIFDVGEAGGAPFIVMEHVTGTSLRARTGDLEVPVAERLRWLTEVARTLSAAHRAGLVHRDVKPENVMLRDDGVVKLLDFGIARRLRGAADPGGSTPGSAEGPGTLDESTIAGTPAYMAPEQVRRQRVDGRADQFAWGVMAYEVLSGALPWRSIEKGTPTLVAIVTERQDPLPFAKLDVPPHVARVIDRALEKDPARRFPTMDDLLAALDPDGTELLRRSLPSPPAGTVGSGSAETPVQRTVPEDPTLLTAPPRKARSLRGRAAVAARAQSTAAFFQPAVTKAAPRTAAGSASAAVAALSNTAPSRSAPRVR